jgi:hypothetical protein
MTSETDWLDENKQDERRKQRADEELAVASLHSIFVSDPRGRKLLELWRATTNARVPVNATIDQYARAEALRSFVQTIEDQIKKYTALAGSS